MNRGVLGKLSLAVAAASVAGTLAASSPIENYSALAYPNVRPADKLHLYIDPPLHSYGYLAYMQKKLPDLVSICSGEEGLVIYRNPEEEWSGLALQNYPIARFWDNIVTSPSLADIRSTIALHRKANVIPGIFVDKGRTFEDVLGKFSDDEIAGVLSVAFLAHESFHSCGGEGKDSNDVGFVKTSEGLEESLAEFFESQEVLKITDSSEFGEFYVENRSYRSKSHQQFLTALQSYNPDLLNKLMEIREDKDVVKLEEYLNTVSFNYLVEKKGFNPTLATRMSKSIASGFISTTFEELEYEMGSFGTRLPEETTRSDAFRAVLEKNGFD